MKKYLTFTFLPILLFMMACVDTTTENADFDISPKKIEFNAEDATPQTVSITPSGADWNFFISDADKLWLSANKDGDKLIITARDNNSRDIRESVITIRPKSETGATPKAVAILQKASTKTDLKELVFDRSALTFEADDTSTQDVIVTMKGGDFKWTAVPEEQNESWFHVVVDGNKITVNVDKNDSTTKQRTGNIIVTPENNTINPKVIKVIQKVLVLPPSLSVTPTADLMFAATDGDLVSKAISVTPVNTDWNARAFDAKNVPVTWVKVKVTKGDDNRIDVGVIPNNTKEAREAFVVISATAADVPTVKVKVHQEGAKDVDSTLEQDVVMNTTSHVVYARPNQIWDINATYSTWDIRFLCDGATYSFDTGEYIGTGGYLLVDRLNTAPFGFNEEAEYTLDNGVYTVSPTNEPNSITKGMNDEGLHRGTWYYTIENNNIVAVSRIVSGTITVTHNGKKTKLDVQLKDDANNDITGIYEALLDVRQEGVPSEPLPGGGGGDEGGVVRAAFKR